MSGQSMRVVLMAAALAIRIDPVFAGSATPAGPADGLRLISAVDAPNEVAAFRLIAKGWSMPFGVLRLHEKGATQEGERTDQRVRIEAGASLSEVVRFLTAKSDRYSFCCDHGVVIATDKRIASAANPLLVVVKDFEFAGTIDGFFDTLTRKILGMGAPMYAFAGAEGRKLLEREVRIKSVGEGSVGGVLAEMSRGCGVNWTLTLVPGAKEIVNDEQAKTIREYARTRLMVSIGAVGR